MTVSHKDNDNVGDRIISDRHGHGDRTSHLTDLEFRVWIQYQNSADDFGVMRCSALQIQNDNAALAQRPTTDIDAALKALVTVRLVRVFTHQKVTYLYQSDWQDFQLKQYVKKTILPKPPSLSSCSPKTRHLFQCHPGPGMVPKFVQDAIADSPKISVQEFVNDSKISVQEFVNDSKISVQEFVNDSKISVQEFTRECTDPVPSRETLTLTLTAGSSGKGGPGEKPPPEDKPPPRELDEMFCCLRDAYPPGRRQDSVLIRQAFVRAFTGRENGQREALFAAMEAGLAQHKKSEQWRTPKLIPNFRTWIEESRWIQQLSEPDSAKPDGEIDLDRVRAKTAEIEAWKKSMGLRR